MYLNLKEARLINERIRLCKSLFFLFGFEARSSFVDFVSEKLGPNAICLSVFLFLLNLMRRLCRTKFNGK